MTTTTRVNLAAGTSRGLLLDLIRSHAPISRVSLVDRTGLTQATVSAAVRSLLDDGLILESGRGESTGGKPPVLLEVNADARYAVGIQLGRESVAFVAVDLAGRVVGRMHGPGLGGRAPGEVIAGLARDVVDMLTLLGVPVGLVIGLGVAAPGPLDIDKGTVLSSPQLTGWQEVRIRDLLQQEVGIPVLLDNDATAAALGDFWSGHLDDSHAHATVYMGSGIGSGVLIDGAALRGASSNGGELGQTVLWVDGAARTLEDLAAPDAVVRLALESPTLARRYDLTTVSPFAGFARIALGAAGGDLEAQRVVRHSADFLALGVLNLADIHDLDSLTLAGPAFEVAGDLYVRAIRTVLGERFFARERHPIRVRMSEQAADAAAVGGAALALQTFLAPRAMGLTPVHRGVVPTPEAGGGGGSPAPRGGPRGGGGPAGRPTPPPP
ncbi:ROK family protein, partial [Amnibacterium sp.]|uniref:ROK family protein n=1 Tax=Amnibacterium sp. TaxID=1872496 RepID=UPI003F7C2929